ncbi:hypothetical protein EV189_1263 [Motilibacter rhizosphaerae]|uniref:Uncharacterized protein n=1 Tax=Motilibacter rhizosphaerae TaxID=598652 RepID=A0A4Q7NR17_9ACTN|nr:hypothetical protein [Motilibacter rhizosphaerae]RZS89496.1 hypothetical protein EV189_1263 [Motilibacter rhizosphaerae]
MARARSLTRVLVLVVLALAVIVLLRVLARGPWLAAPRTHLTVPVRYVSRTWGASLVAAGVAVVLLAAAASLRRRAVAALAAGAALVGCAAYAVQLLAVTRGVVPPDPGACDASNPEVGLAIVCAVRLDPSPGWRGRLAERLADLTGDLPVVLGHGGSGMQLGWAAYATGALLLVLAAAGLRLALRAPA